MTATIVKLAVERYSDGSLSELQEESQEELSLLQDARSTETPEEAVGEAYY